MTNVLYLPDGNRRFALNRSIPLSEAYALGGKTLKLTSQFFLAEERAKMLVYHALSSYTHKRIDSSLDSIFNAAAGTFEDLVQEDFFRSNGIKFRAIDHSGKIPARITRAIESLSDSTSKCGKGECVVLLGYSLEADTNQALACHPADYESFRKRLIFPEDIDLVIRPGEMRPSGGPVYAMPRAQMITLDKLNPEISRGDLENIWQMFLKLNETRIKGNPVYHQ